MKYNLTRLYLGSGISRTAFSNWKKRTLIPFAKTYNHSITTYVGNSGKNPQGTYTDSIECYNLCLQWINKSSFVSFKRVELQFEQDILRNLFAGYKILSQHFCCNNKYRIDWYLPELNLVIEFDEPHHNQNCIKDSIRQKEIEKELKCKFLRYTYKYEN